MRHHDEAEAALAKEGWLKLQTTRDPRRWKPRYFVCDVRGHSLRWYRDKSKAPAGHKAGWELNLQNAQIVLLEKFEYDKMSGPTEIWDLVDPDTDSTSNSEGEAPSGGVTSFDMLSQHQTASKEQVEEALAEMCHVQVRTIHDDTPDHRVASALRLPTPYCTPTPPCPRPIPMHPTLSPVTPLDVSVC
jgi:hypothetical protein